MNEIVITTEEEYDYIQGVEEAGGVAVPISMREYIVNPAAGDTYRLRIAGEPAQWPIAPGHKIWIADDDTLRSDRADIDMLLQAMHSTRATAIDDVRAVGEVLAAAALYHMRDVAVFLDSLYCHSTFVVCWEYRIPERVIRAWRTWREQHGR